MIFTLHYDRMHRRLMISLWTQQELASSNVDCRREVEANSHGCRWDRGTTRIPRLLMPLTEG